MVDELPDEGGRSRQIRAILTNRVRVVFGPDSFAYGNGLVGTVLYDSMGRGNNHYDCVQGSYTNCAYGNRTDFSGNRVTRIADTALNVGLNTSLTYDSLNRLTGVNYPGMGKAYTMAFDRYGNRWSQTYTQGSGPQPSVTFNTANQISAMGYDLSGNLTNDGLHSYTYDDDGNLIEVDGGNSSFNSYDALNHRVASLPGGVYTLYGYDADGRRVLTFDGNSGNLVSTNVFLGDRLLATYKGGQVYFQHVDPLGTVRASTDATGSVSGSFQSLPFGDGYTTAGTDTDPQHFAELDKDFGDTHNAQYRQYDSAQARWMSPDPYDGSYDLTNPQSLNRYVYVLNNPLGAADPSGHCPAPAPGVFLEACVVEYSAQIGTAACGPVCGAVAGIIAAAAELTLDLFEFKPAFNGSLTPRPSARRLLTSGRGYDPHPEEGATSGGNGNFTVVAFYPDLDNPTNAQLCRQTLSNARNLDYSQKLYKGKAQSTQQHIEERHMSGLQGVSQYYGNDFWQVRNLNAVTFFLGYQTVEGSSRVFELTFPDLAASLHLRNYIGTDATRQPTLTNHLVVSEDCKTVVSSYPVPD